MAAPVHVQISAVVAQGLYAATADVILREKRTATVHRTVGQLHQTLPVVRGRSLRVRQKHAALDMYVKAVLAAGFAKRLTMERVIVVGLDVEAYKDILVLGVPSYPTANVEVIHQLLTV